MKERAINKMHKAGKIGRIICNVLIVLGIIVSIVMLVATLIVGVIPKDLVNLNMRTNTTVTVDMNELAKLPNTEGISQEFVKERLGLISDNMSINNMDSTPEKITLDGSTITVESVSEQVDGINIAVVRKVLLSVFAYVLAVTIMLFVVKAIFKAIEKCDSPFSEDVIKKISNFAYALIPWLIFNTIMNGLINVFTLQTNKFVLDVNFGIIIEAIVILGLAYIFKYGAMLQKESDETL